MNKIDGKRVLVIDEKVADVVRLMFHLASQGKSNIQIARELTETYTTPAEYKRTGKVFKDKEDIKQWDTSYISKILSDEVYIGNLIQRIHSNRNDLNLKSKFRDKEEWIITENTHEGFIDKITFENIREIKEKKQNHLTIH